MASKRPDWVKPRWEEKWDKPWTVSSKLHRSPLFKRALRRHGYLSPHYKLRAARCSDGTDVPKGKLRRRAQQHAFDLERFSRVVGRIVRPISWYRTEAYNAAIGGASGSKHLRAIATDYDREQIAKIGTARFDRAAEIVFAEGGFGSYPGGSRHVDSRAGWARWSSW